MVRPIANERGISLQIDSVGQTTTVMADRQRLQQVLINLLSNAVKYNRANGSVSVSCTSYAGTTARISVVDTGLGIDKDQHYRVFAPFERLDNVGDVEGSGIGLALSRHLTDAMGGEIGMDSELGRGSTFWVDLPVAAQPADTFGAIEPGRADVAGSDVTERTVLQIEDNPANYRLVERILGRAFGVRLLTATSAAEGVAVAKAHHPDLILLDLHLPDLSGRDVLTELKRRPELRGVKVIILTADAHAGLSRQMKLAGAAGYLTKPFDIDDVLAHLDETLEAKGQHR
jgi:CheY-like chemotaxis protein